LSKDDVVTVLQRNGLEIVTEARLKNETGWQLRLKGGQVVNIYDKGTVVVQGKDTQAVKDLLGVQTTPSSNDGSEGIKAGNAGNRNIFVVYGHHEQAKNKLETMLRRWGLNPLILDQLPSGGQTIIEKLESLRGEANFAVVLATPDDQGHRAGHNDEKKFRARQNVVLELGMMLSTLGRPRVAILLKDQKNMERPSDIDGLIYIPFEDDVEETKLLLAKEINQIGIKIDLSNL
jgi:predicted nucleotide-binding protein